MLFCEVDVRNSRFEIGDLKFDVGDQAGEQPAKSVHKLMLIQLSL